MKSFLKSVAGIKEQEVVQITDIADISVDGITLQKRNRNFTCYQKCMTFVKRITSSNSFCLKCNAILLKNNANQIQNYCTDICRAGRHNINSLKVRKFRKAYRRANPVRRVKNVGEEKKEEKVL